jgi:hypothetical protein
MYIDSRKASLVSKILVMAAAGVGIYLNSGLPQGGPEPRMFVYFTIISILFCFVYFIVAVVYGAKKLKEPGGAPPATVLPHFKGAFMMAIMVTFIIYHFVLAPEHFAMDASNTLGASNIIVHYIVTFAVWADWALFDKKGVFRPFDPLIWALVPLCYLFFCLIRAEVSDALLMNGSRYPYFFIDADVLGVAGVFVNVLLFAAFFMALGYGLYFLDRGLGRLAAKGRSR